MLILEHKCRLFKTALYLLPTKNKSRKISTINSFALAVSCHSRGQKGLHIVRVIPSQETAWRQLNRNIVRIVSRINPFALHFLLLPGKSEFGHKTCWKEEFSQCTSTHKAFDKFYSVCVALLTMFAHFFCHISRPVVHLEEQQILRQRATDLLGFICSQATRDFT